MAQNVISATLHTDRRQHNYLNEIMSKKVDSAAAVPFGYDKNGNLLADGVRKYEWDALNRLVRVKKADDTLLATYTYDALSRRVRKDVVASLQTGVPAQALDLLYGGWRRQVSRRCIAT